MRTRQKVLGLVTAAALMATLLSGCGEAKPDPVKDVMGYKGSTVMFTVDGHDVTASDYLFFLGKTIDQLKQMYAMYGREFDWEDAAADGTKMDEYVKKEAMETAKFYVLVEKQANDRGYTFTEEDQANYDEQIAAAIEDLGGQEAYDTYLKTVCITEEGMLKLNRIAAQYTHLKEGMSQEGGELWSQSTPEKLTTFAEEGQYTVAKHILLSTVDSTTGAALDEATIQQKKAKAEEIAGRLSQSDDPIPLFDELMQQNTEDPGIALNPDGYAFRSGEMVEAFETAATALEPGQISGVVESDFGYHIILRIAPSESKALQTLWAATELEDLQQQWMDDAEVKETDTYKNLNAKDFYEKLTAYRESLEETDEVDPGLESGDQPQDGQDQPNDNDGKDNSGASDSGTNDAGNTGDQGDAGNGDAGDKGTGNPDNAGGSDAGKQDDAGKTPQE